MHVNYIVESIMEIQAGGLSGKALSAANKLAPALGAWMAWTQPAGTGDLASKMNFYVEALKGFKIANPVITTQIALGQPDRYPIATRLPSGNLTGIP